MSDKLIKSKKRVKDFGEVYGATPYMLSNLEEPIGRWQALIEMIWLKRCGDN